jgi:hypothetical protein
VSPIQASPRDDSDDRQVGSVDEQLAAFIAWTPSRLPPVVDGDLLLFDPTPLPTPDLTEDDLAFDAMYETYLEERDGSNATVMAAIRAETRRYMRRQRSARTRVLPAPSAVVVSPRTDHGRRPRSRRRGAGSRACSPGRQRKGDPEPLAGRRR